MKSCFAQARQKTTTNHSDLHCFSPAHMIEYANALACESAEAIQELSAKTSSTSFSLQDTDTGSGMELEKKQSGALFLEDALHLRRNTMVPSGLL